MASVDDRIVRMEFDNASFERKLASTLASLGHLDKALKMTGATKGLTDVNDAASKLNMGTISAGIENVSKSFIALGTVAITILSNITSKALMAGAHIAKAFTLSPIIEGFREYETQLNSVQTILANTASKGTTLDQVNDALQRLNTYSDQTIYNFGQMARNIGTFTAAGVDLETSVSSIKGIANLAAMSGSTSEQASTAMYQLSQAIAAGSLKLMDWNSVVNAGMGGEAFKSALFETQKAMGNVLNVPVGQTFVEWEDAGNSFRETLQDGWITADVLTTTLSAFTGDMTEEMLLQKGFNEQQAAAILKTAAIAKAAATEVKTFTQLIGTVKEAIGTGWADSFKIIIGNFNEAKALWTDVNNAIGGFVNKTSDARNEILQGWKDFGGRTTLIEAFKTALFNISSILQPIGEAFRAIFPPVTAATLIRLTESFKEFAQALAPTAETISKIRSISSGFFAALSIGWEIIKEGTKFLIGLAKSLLGLVTPGATGFLVKLSDGLVSLQQALVAGGGIKAFFATLTSVLKKPLEFLEKIKDAIGNIFGLFDRDAANQLEDGMGRIGDRFESLKGLFASAGRLWEPFENALRKIVDVLDNIWDVIKNWFKEFGKKLGDVLGEGDFNNVLDAINVGLLGGIALLLRKFFKEGFKFDLGGGLFEKISATFEQLTGVLKSMQLSIKADALLKIAGAIAILTASVVVLSMIDSAALTRALSAMAVGFGELMASFALLSKMASTPTGAASFTILAAGLVILAGAILVLSLAVKLLSTMEWEELARGLAGITGLLGGLVLASKLLSKNVAGMISAGIGITAIAVGLVILAVAMKIFATMGWEEMGKGLAGVAGGLILIGAAMKGMPATMPITAAGLILVGIALLLIASAIGIFGNMEWEEIGKGMAAIGGGLLIIAGAMQLMPISLPITAAGLILVGLALAEIGGALKIMGSMSWKQIAKGLVAMAGALTILAVAMYAMQSSIAGAAALVVVAVGLGILVKVLKEFASLSWDDLLHGLAALAIAVAGIGLIAFAAQTATPFILSLGAALIVLGAGFALIGLGAMLVGKGLESIAKSGAKAAEQLPAILKAVGEAIPAFMTGIAKGFIEMTKVFIKSAPVFAEAIGKLLMIIITELEKLIPKLGTVIRLLIEEIFKIVRSYAAEYIATGLFILTKLLEGLKQNVAPITALVFDIINKFLIAFEKEIPRTVTNVKNLLITMFEQVAFAMGEIAGTILMSTGTLFIEGFIKGAENTVVGQVIGWFVALPGRVLDFIGDVASTLWQKGLDIIQGFLNGAFQKFMEVVSWFGGLAGIIGGLIKEPLNILEEVGKKIMEGLKNGLEKVWNDIKDFINGIADWIADHKGPPEKDAKLLYNNGLLIMEGLHHGMQEQWGKTENWISKIDPAKSLNNNLGSNMARALSNAVNQMSSMEEFNPVITPVLDLTEVEKDASKLRHHIQNAEKFSPKVSHKQAQLIASQQRQRANNVETETAVPQGVSFTQINNSPTQLSTSDIYKQTRNQIRIAKEELKIP